MTNQRHNRGFTLLEMIVSIGLFLTVLFATTSAFLNIVNADRASRAVRMTMDNLNVALEDMTRLLKTGTTYTNPSGLTSIKFIDQDGRDVTYALEGGKIMRTIDGEKLPATAEDISITNLHFTLHGTETFDSGDTEQPSVLIQIGGEMKTGKNQALQAPFTIQTLVTQRAYDL